MCDTSQRRRAVSPADGTPRRADATGQAGTGGTAGTGRGVPGRSGRAPALGANVSVSAGFPVTTGQGRWAGAVRGRRSRSDGPHLTSPPGKRRPTRSVPRDAISCAPRRDGGGRADGSGRQALKGPYHTGLRGLLPVNGSHEAAHGSGQYWQNAVRLCSLNSLPLA